MKRFLCIIFSVAVLSVKALTLVEARQLARDNYPLVRDFNLIALTGQYTLENASKAWLPQISAGAQATWQTAVAEYPEVLREMLEQRGVQLPGMNRFQWKGRIDVEQLLWDGGRIKASQAVASGEEQENRQAVEVELYQLRNRIDDIYFGILLLTQQSDAIKNSLEVLEANLGKVKTLVSNGAAMQCDADAVEAELLTASQQLVSVDSTIKSYRDILSLYIGERASENLDEPEPLMLPTDANFTLRPEQQLFSARLATIDARQREVQTSIMPKIGAFAQGYFGYPGLNFMEAMMSRDPSFNAMVGISISWNISSLYTRKNKLRSLQAAAGRIAVARDVFDFNAKVAAIRQRNELARLHHLAESDNEIIYLRRRVRNASEARLREGIVEPTDLLLRIADERNAMIAASAHRIEYLKNQYQLQTIFNCE